MVAGFSFVRFAHSLVLIVLSVGGQEIGHGSAVVDVVIMRWAQPLDRSRGAVGV
jgi:hypothetical protein